MTRSTPFWKVQSIGNDFVLLHADELPHGIALEALARAACDRKFGIGSDGLLVLSRDLVLRMFNPDGTEDFCGNGLRCAAMHARVLGWAGNDFAIEHLGRRVAIRGLDDGRIQTTLGAASYAPSNVPLARDHAIFDEPIHILGRSYRASTLSTGTTHTVLQVSALPEDDEFFEVSRALEHHMWFPERTSVMWTVADGPDALRMRIWERGAGETLGCGTGSMAASVDTLRRSGRGGAVQVHNPGGALTVSADGWDQPITVTGRASEVFAGQLRDELVSQIRLPAAFGAC